MAQENRERVVLMTRGADHELSSVGFTIACGGLTAGMKVCAFLTSSAVDLVRRRAADLPHVPPLDPLKALIDDFMKRGGTVVACPPCVKARGYTQEDFIDRPKHRKKSPAEAGLSNLVAPAEAGARMDPRLNPRG